MRGKHEGSMRGKHEGMYAWKTYFLFDKRPSLELLTVVFCLSTVHQPFYIFICISTLPRQHRKCLLN